MISREHELFLDKSCCRNTMAATTRCYHTHWLNKSMTEGKNPVGVLNYFRIQFLIPGQMTWKNKQDPLAQSFTDQRTFCTIHLILFCHSLKGSFFRNLTQLVIKPSRSLVAFRVLSRR